MSWSDAVTASGNLFRTTSTGLRVFAPAVVVGRLAVVSDDDARRIQGDVRRGMALLVALALFASRLFQQWGWGAVAVGALGMGLAFRFWLARGLPTVSRRDVTLIQ